MQIEKRLVACSILAIAIGIATIIPIVYLMNTKTVAADDVKPWFNINVSYATCNPNQSGGNGTATWDGASIQVVANFTLTTDALTDADAQIEYYKFAVSSDEGSIVDIGYYIIEDKSNIVESMSGDGSISFSNGVNYDEIHSSGGQAINWQAWKPDSVLGFVSDNIVAYNGGDLPIEIAQIRKATTLYIDVTKIATVTVKGVTDGNVIITAPTNPEVLQHIVLTKTDDGKTFVYGNYTQGSLPLPIGEPSMPQQPLKIFNTTSTPPQ